MIPTLFGVLTVGLCGFLLWQSSTLAMLQTVMLLSLMGGAAAIVLSSLGGSTVQPAILALGFLTLRCLAPAPGSGEHIVNAFARLVFLAGFVLYGVIGAMILPRIFAGALDVTPLRPIPNGYLFAAFPLAFSSQNITSAVYLTSTLMAALCAFLACRTEGAWRAVARTASVIAAIHAVLGLASVVLAGTGIWSLFQNFFRNGFYAQLDQTMEGVSRMTGIFPESSVYAAYGFVWLVFVTELWLRRVEPRWTSKAAAILSLALLLSTSTTAYIGLTAYILSLSLRMVFFPGSIDFSKALLLIAGGLVMLAALIALIAFHPQAAAALGEFTARFTVAKAESASAMQRAFWAKQGWSGFLISSGLGIGPGSFRSSSIVLAVLGSTGVIGSVCFICHLARTFQPLSRSTYFPTDDPVRNTGVAASWAVTVMLVPASVSAATADPGIVWGMLCGVALALRPAAVQQGGNPIDTTL